MQKSALKWDDLRVFLAVARQSRLLAAGRTLALDPATVGRRITALEEALGSKFFDRSRAGDGEPRGGGGRGRGRPVRPALGHGAHRRPGRSLELSADRGLRRAQPGQPRPPGAGRGAAAHVLVVQARGRSRDHRLAALGGTPDRAQDRRLPAAPLRARGPAGRARAGRDHGGPARPEGHRLHLRHDLRQGGASCSPTTSG